MGKRTLILLVAAGLSGLFGGCSVQRIAVRTATGPLIDGGFEAMMAEDDLVIAKTSLESNLTLIEGLLRSDPNNQRLRLVAAQGFTAYALAFAEDSDPARAKKLYLRGRQYAATWLRHRTGVDLLAIENIHDFEAAVQALPTAVLPGVFWLGNAWASALMLSLDDITAVGDLPRVEALMAWVQEHDESYYFAGAHLFFGAYYGVRARMLGGDPDKARAHLERQQELTGGTMLLGKFFIVKYVDLPALDGEAARQHLEEILNSDPSTWQEDRILINRVTQEKAAWLLDHLEDYL
ncbi:MAG: TRAP transporter TatT component family protein [bacterium]